MKVTLADIAKKTGVTISTVQRALNRGGGVSDEKRELIQKVATEMGYKRNFYASTLRRGPVRIAVAFPDTSWENRAHSAYLWAGVERYLKEADVPHVEMASFPYKSSPEDHAVALQEIADGTHGHFDGIITRGSMDAVVNDIFEEIEQQNIPLVLAGADSLPKHRLSCVRTYEQMAGAVVANLLLGFGGMPAQSKVVVCGTFSGLNQFNNAQGFERQLWEIDSNINVLKISRDLDFVRTQAGIREILQRNPNVSAIYACSTRSTLSACSVVKELGLAGKITIIGSDLFEESVDMLRSGVISAIVHNKPLDLAYRSIQALVNYLTNPNDPPPDTIYIEAATVMRANLDFHLQDLPVLQRYLNPDKVECHQSIQL